MNTKKTEELLLSRLIEDIRIHPHKDELLDIMYQQLQDDTLRV